MFQTAATVPLLKTTRFFHAKELFESALELNLILACLRISPNSPGTDPMNWNCK